MKYEGQSKRCATYDSMVSPVRTTDFKLVQ
jgi:hypothetical protein